MTRIKICGISNGEDALAAARYGADALGFIAVPGSPRYVPEFVYHEISEALPLFVKRVVVVQRPEDAEEYLAEYVQHYEDTTDKARFRRGAQWRIRAFRNARTRRRCRRSPIIRTPSARSCWTRTIRTSWAGQGRPSTGRWRAKPPG